MIKYTLKCEAGHSFESWFQSAEAFEGLKTAGHLSCAVCGSGSVEKAIMSPQVRSGRALSEPATPDEEKLKAMRRHVEENSTYVGDKFSREARAMHEGEAPERAIWGEARPEDAKALIEDGVPVAPLPFMPRRKAN